LISEVLGDPTGADRDKEWVELHAPNGPVDLNGLVLENRTAAGSSAAAQIASPTCLRVPQGAYAIVLFVHEDDAAIAYDNGGVTPAAIALTTKDSFLYGSAVTMTVRSGTTIVDTAEVPAAVSGASQSVDPDLLDAVSNDDPASFCRASSTGVFPSGTGTPGAANDSCGPGPQPGDRCLDGTTERPVVVPAAGDLFFTEVYANPPDTDANRDWVEIASHATGPVDLNGLFLTSTTAAGTHRDWQLTSTACVSVAPGGRVVVGGSAAGVGFAVGLTFTGPSADLMYATNARVTLSSGNPPLGGGTVIDETPLLNMSSSTTRGISKSLDTAITTAAGNDVVACWCDSVIASGGFQDPATTGDELGSPGVANTEDCALCP
jgi:hypothetical protein